MLLPACTCTNAHAWQRFTCKSFTCTDLMYCVFFFLLTCDFFLFYCSGKKLEETIIMKDSMIKQMSAELELKNRKG